jgi:hypothetical protein
MLALLGRAEGATMAGPIAATGWLSHTTGAALTGLRKKDHAIMRGKRGDSAVRDVFPTSQLRSLVHASGA